MPRLNDVLPRTVEPSYLDQLQRAWRDSGLKPPDIGLSKMTVSRIMRADARPKLATVARFHQAFVGRTGLPFPPPVVLMGGSEDYELLQLGRTVRSATRHNYDEILDLLRVYADAAERARMAREAAAKVVGERT